MKQKEKYNLKYWMNLTKKFNKINNKLYLFTIIQKNHLFIIW